MTEELPNCFGDPKLHDNKCTECAGGYDPSYTDASNHVRPKCGVFEACGSQVRAKTAAAKLGNGRAYLPTMPSTPMRPATATLAPSRTYQTPQQQVSFVSPQNLQAPQGPVMVPAQMMPVNYGMPSYLSVLEPKRLKKGRKWMSLRNEVGRSIGKSVGHSLAHFFDSVTWGDDD